MAINLRKWLGTLKELKWRQDYNENMTDIETAINDLEANNSLSVASYTTDSKVFKRGTHVHFDKYIFNDIAAGAIIETLPAGFRPLNAVSFRRWFQTTASTWASIVFTVATDGKLTAGSTLYRGQIVIDFLIDR